MTRKCNRCELIKDISNFYKDKANSPGYGYKCKPCDIIARKERKNNNPWQKHLESLRKRCNYVKHDNYHRYGGRGIKALITNAEIKKLWFRDKAYLMKKPSIDREDNDGDYTYENCRFMEMIENSKKSNFENQRKILQYDLDGNFIKEWHNAKIVAKELNFSVAKVRRICRGDFKKGYNFIWKYKKEK